MVAMSSDEVIENINSIVFVEEYFDDFQKLLQLIIFFSGNLRKFNQNPFPNLQPVKLRVIQFDLRQFEDSC